MAAPRPHIILRGLGDRYLSHGDGRVVCNGIPMADVPIVKPKEKPVPARGTSLEIATSAPLERERALLGALIMGWRSREEVDDHVHDFSHRQILDTLASLPVLHPLVYPLREGARLAATVDACRAAGLDPVLCGRRDGEVVSGYLHGCVRSAKSAGLEMDHVHGLEYGGAPHAPHDVDVVHADVEGVEVVAAPEDVDPGDVVVTVVTDEMIDDLAAQPTEDEAEAWDR